MRNLLFLIVVIANALTQTKANELNDTLHTPTDSLKRNFRFELRKPYIGWEVMGPSNLVAFTYQQQFLRLGKYSYLDLQLLCNNLNNYLIENFTYDPDEEINVKNHGTYKLLFYLTERNRIFRWLNLELSAGFYYYQDWTYNLNTSYFRNNDSLHLILKGSLNINLSKNTCLKFNVNRIFLKDKDDFIDVPLLMTNRTSYSLSLLFSFYSFFKKKEENETTYAFKNNQIFLNFTKMQLGYERVLFRYHDLNMSASLATHAIPFKRYGEYSNKKGWHTLSDAMINFNYSLNKKLYSFIGLGTFYNYITYYVLNDQFNMHTYGFRSNIGLACKLNKRMAVKLAYTPYITKDININIENMDYFVFIRQYKLNLILSYSFGK